MSVTISGSGQIVKQVIYATYATTGTNGSSTFATTGLTATITPTNSANKILVLTHGVFYNGASNRGIALQVTRGGTIIYTTIGAYSVYTGTTNIVVSLDVNTLDSPATTSATTYTLNYASADNNGSVTSNYNNTTSTMILMEIAYA